MQFNVKKKLRHWMRQSVNESANQSAMAMKQTQWRIANSEIVNKIERYRAKTIGLRPHVHSKWMEGFDEFSEKQDEQQ